MQSDWRNATLRTLQASVSALEVKVHSDSFGIRLDKFGLFGMVKEEIFFLWKGNMAAHLRFAKLHLNEPQDF